MSGLDCVIDTEVFRKDYRMILAMNRHQAAIVPVRLQYEVLGYKAGQTLARNSVSGLWCKYATSGSSGTDTATGILFSDALDMAASTTGVAQQIVKGQVYESLCLDLDSAAKVDLGARSVVDASGTTILVF